MPTPERSSEQKRTSRWRGWPVLLFIGLALAGIFGHEAAEILLNATLLCLSCLGLGR